MDTCRLLDLIDFYVNYYDVCLRAALRAAQTCRYLVYSEADFEVFAPQGGDMLYLISGCVGCRVASIV